jgi:hypothetical protein
MNGSRYSSPTIILDCTLTVLSIITETLSKSDIGH